MSVPQKRRLRLTESAAELKRLLDYNRDQRRVYPQVSRQNQGTRSGDVMKALAVAPSKFMLWAQVRQLARGIHKPSEALTSVSITKALRMLTDSAAKPTTSATTAAHAKGAAA